MSDRITEKLQRMQEQLAAGVISRRDFLRYVTMMGVTVGAAEAWPLARPSRRRRPYRRRRSRRPQFHRRLCRHRGSADGCRTDCRGPDRAGPGRPGQARRGSHDPLQPAVVHRRLVCSFACADHWMTKYFPEQAADTINLEFARIRPMRFQWVDVLNQCQDCRLLKWLRAPPRPPASRFARRPPFTRFPRARARKGTPGYGYLTVDATCAPGSTCAGAAWKSAKISLQAAFPSTPLRKRPRSVSLRRPAQVRGCLPEPGALAFFPQQATAATGRTRHRRWQSCCS